MERQDLETWLSRHPDLVHTEAHRLLDRCETEVRRHAKRDAWHHARDVAAQSRARFERVFGLPASEEFVTREVCHEIARELRSHEPHPDRRQAAEWVGRAILESLDGEARQRLVSWLTELAQREEHATWRSIVRFTDHHARSLIRDQHMTRDLEWDFDRSYPRVAARVAELMIREFEARELESRMRPA